GTARQSRGSSGVAEETKAATQDGAQLQLPASRGDSQELPKGATSSAGGAPATSVSRCSSGATQEGLHSSTAAATNAEGGTSTGAVLPVINTKPASSSTTDDIGKGPLESSDESPKVQNVVVSDGGSKKSQTHSSKTPPPQQDHQRNAATELHQTVEEDDVNQPQYMGETPSPAPSPVPLPTPPAAVRQKSEAVAGGTGTRSGSTKSITLNYNVLNQQTIVHNTNPAQQQNLSTLSLQQQHLINQLEEHIVEIELAHFAERQQFELQLQAAKTALTVQKNF
ncbi:unnamed protein product, partial [Amoebophrya sp. A120]